MLISAKVFVHFKLTFSFAVCIIGDPILPHLEWEPAAPALHL